MSNNDKFTPKQFSTSDDQEDESTLILQNLVRNNQAVKLRLGGNDKTPNYDGIIELRNDKHVIGKLEVQVRPVDPQRTDRPCYQVDASLVGYSRISGLPFLLICYDRKNDKAYWKKIDDSLFDGAKTKQKSITVNFEPTDEIRDGMSYSDDWLKISKDHLEIHKQAEQLRKAISVLKSSAGDSFPGLLDSPENLGQLLQQLIDTSKEKYRARLEEAQKLLRESEIAAATKIVSELEKELSTKKDEQELLVSVRNCLGNCYIRLEQFAEAEACFREALREDEFSWKAQCNLAHALYIRNTAKAEALELSEKAYKAQGDNEFVVSVYLLCLSFADTQAKFDKFLKDRADFIGSSSEIQIALAQIHKERADFRTARTRFERAAELDGSNVHIQILLAETIYKNIRSNAMSSIAHGRMPNQEESKAETQAALAGLDVAIKKLSETTDRKALCRAYELYALLTMLSGDFGKAITACDKMDAVLPGRESCKVIKGQIFTQTDQFEDAVNLLEPLAATGRRDVLQILACSHYRLANYGEAAKFFTAYIEDTDGDQEWFAYTQSLWLCGEKKRAYQAAYQLRKAGKAPIVIMREVELKRVFELEEWRAALDVLEDLIKAEPENAEHWLNRLAMNMNLQRKERALEMYAALPRELIESDGWARPKLIELELGMRKMGWIR